jgi:ankyrin repeat protein
MDSPTRLFRAIFDHNAESVRKILTDRPDLVNAWVSGKLHQTEFVGEISDSRGFEAPFGLDPISYAIARDAAAIVDLLIRMGASTESLSHNGNMGWCTPIVLAAFSNRTEIVSILVKHGASLNSIGSAGQTALMTAAEHGRTDIVDILSAAGADMTIHAAATLGLTNEVERILSESRAWLEARDGYRQATPLFYAAGANRAEMIKMLIAQGANLNSPDNWGWTPLLRAAHTTCNDAVMALVQAGAELNYTSSSDRWGLPAGSNALHAVCYGDKTTSEVVQALLDHEVNANLRDAKGQTPFDVAEANSNVDVLAVLNGRIREHLRT